MKKIEFRYTNSLFASLLWLLFGLIGAALFLLPSVEKFSIWIIDKFDLTGFILVFLFVILYVVIIMIGSYYLSLKITDKKGVAIFSEDFVEIIMGRKYQIYYTEIINLKYDEIITSRGVGKGGYKLNIKTKNINLKIRNSIKELWENRMKDLRKKFSIFNFFRLKWKSYHSKLEDIYDEIELHIALKFEPQDDK